MTVNYTGNLFQLWNGTSTLNIGQINGKVNLSTWPAFCGGVASNCKYSKIYAQINTGANDLTPSTFNVTSNGGPNCTASTYVCAAPFLIDTNTNLPIVTTGTGQEYIVAGETAATGITGGTSSMSMIYNGINIQATLCCGPFGIGHSYLQADTQGTAFYVLTQYGIGTFNPCKTSTAFCTGIDEESNGDVADYSSVVQSIVSGVTFNSATNTVTAVMNGQPLFSRTPPQTTLNVGLYIHFGGGADLSQPADGNMREVLISNAALTNAQQAIVFYNMRNFFGCSLFPNNLAL